MGFQDFFVGTEQSRLERMSFRNVFGEHAQYFDQAAVSGCKFDEDRFIIHHFFP